jgi:hypothetical protein
MRYAARWQTGLASAVLLAYLIPEVLALVRSPVFVFVNGWDEETYLSWQGALGTRNAIGYLVLWPYSLMHGLGVSGAMQNFWSDMVLPLASVGLIAAAFKRFDIAPARAYAYAVLILFSSTLFNHANPVVAYLQGGHDAQALFMAGWEWYPAILRTPNPQASYFLIALAACAWAHWRRDWLLLLPLPLLYYFVAVPYMAVLALAAGWRMWTRRQPDAGPAALLAGALLLWLAMGGVATLLFWVTGYYTPDNLMRQDPWVYAATRRPQIPLMLLFFALFYLAFRGLGWIEAGRTIRLRLFALALITLASVNLHVVTGFMLSQKNYYDYGLSIVFGLMTVTGIHMLRGKAANWILTGVLALVFVPTLASQLHFYTRAVSIAHRAAPYAETVRADPTHALILDRDVSSRMAYAHARLPAPPFSYQYYFSFIERQCGRYPGLLDAALDEVKRTLPETAPARTALHETEAQIRNGQARAARIPYRFEAYCTEAAYAPTAFKILGHAP